MQPPPPPPPAAAPEPRPRPASPCNGICTMGHLSGLCVGCWRTLGEIAGWGEASANEREQVWQRIALRRAAVGAGGMEGGASAE